VAYTGWLKLKYPTGQNAISRQPCEIFIPKFLGLYGRDPGTILKLKKNYFSFLQSYGYINILCHIFNSARNNQQQLVIFHSRHGFCGHLFRWEGKIAFNSQQDQSESWNPVAGTCSRLASFCNRTPRLHTRQSWLKTVLLPTAVNSLVKINSLQTRLTSTLWTTISGELRLNATSHFNPARQHRWAQESSAVDMGPAATRLDQQSHIELPKKTSGLCESWWWTLRTYAKMNYLSDFGICIKRLSVFLDSKNYKLLLIIPCRIENMALNIYTAITLEKTKIFFQNFRIVAGSLSYKPRNLGIKISHGCREIAFCLVGYFNLSHPVHREFSYESICERILKIGPHFVKVINKHQSSGIVFLRHSVVIGWIQEWKNDLINK